MYCECDIDIRHQGIQHVSLAILVFFSSLKAVTVINLLAVTRNWTVFLSYQHSCLSRFSTRSSVNFPVCLMSKLPVFLSPVRPSSVSPGWVVSWKQRFSVEVQPASSGAEWGSLSVCLWWLNVARGGICSVLIVMSSCYRVVFDYCSADRPHSGSS